jgi:ATP-binding cassette, subfamily B, bacterial
MIPLKNFPFYQQHNTMDCGSTCLRMIAKYYGKTISLETLRKKTFPTREGVSLLDLSDAAETIGFKTLATQTALYNLLQEITIPELLIMAVYLKK